MPLYVLDEKLCGQWPVLFPGWKKTFPGMDVLTEIRKAHQWEMEQEPKDRKKARARFLGRWLRTAQTKLDLRMPGAPPRALPALPTERVLMIRELGQWTGHRVIYRGDLVTVTTAGLWREGEGVTPWSTPQDFELRDLLQRVKGR